MSMDNGTYILKCADQYRVINACAIENLYWSYVLNNEVSYLVPTRIIEYFGHAKPIESEQSARAMAFHLEDSIQSEYGIKTIKTNKTWDQIIEYARYYAQQEIEAIRKSGCEWMMKMIPDLEKMLLNQ